MNISTFSNAARHGLAAALLLLATLAPASAQGSFVVRGARVFTGDDVLEGADVLVRDGVVAAVGQGVEVTADVEAVDGAGKTLLPGLIDCHVHAFGAALVDALAFGVTTELDMFTAHAEASRLRAEQAAGKASGRADLFSAGTLVTAEGGHGTQFGLPIPTLAGPADAAAFVAARIAEGSDYIKIISEDGKVVGRPIPTLDRATIAAVIQAAHSRGKLAVVHASTRERALQALADGADGLVHVYYEPGPDDAAGRERADAELVDLARDGGAFVVPTLAVLEGIAGRRAGARMVEDEKTRAALSPMQQQTLTASFPPRENVAGEERLRHVLDRVARLERAGVPVLAGTDSPNPGTAHGISMHRELELLVEAGLSPAAALAAATSRPADAFGLADRGRIAPGKKADLLLVEGNPLDDVGASDDIVAIWKDGRRFDRPRHLSPDGSAAGLPKVSTGVVSTFDGGELDARFGSWSSSTDAIAGGKSTVALELVPGGAAGTPGALRIAGELARGFAFPWAGAFLSPGAAPFAPVDASSARAIAFWARGQSKLSVMVFTQSGGQMPRVQEVVLGPEWQRHVLPLERFETDGSDLSALLFSGAELGPFELFVDEVALE
jgi:imidazolonepropionase-like amidohydrolase